jgi:hypothetical protein
MELPIGVLGVFAALVIWAGFLVRGFQSARFSGFLIFGLGLMLFLNVRYLIEGSTAGIAFFIGIYDVLINIGLRGSVPEAMMACEGNACTVWGDIYTTHPAWGVAFYERFANGPEFRSQLLYGHIAFNSLAFVLLHIQLMRPAGQPGGNNHRLLGRISFAALCLSLICAVWLASQHGAVAEYGGAWSTWGFYSMAAVVFSCAAMGVIAIRAKDRARHRVWMFRYAGSMWGSFWLFRVMLFVIDPLLRDYESAAILWCIWMSAPLGVLLGELVRRWINARANATDPALARA